MKEFIEEFCIMSIQSGHIDEEEEVVEIYVNGIKYAI